MSGLNLSALSGKTVLASTFARGTYAPETFKPPEGFVKLEVDISKVKQSPDFEAAAYVNPKTGELVVAYRGSDTVSEAAQAAYWAKAGTWNGQFTDAASFAKQAEGLASAEVKSYSKTHSTSEVPVTTLYTGHSLGGLIAQVMSKMFGHDAQVFDSLGGGRLIETQAFKDNATLHGQPEAGHDITGKIQNYATSIASDQGLQLGGTTSVPALGQLGGIGVLPVLVGALTGGVGPIVGVGGAFLGDELVGKHDKMAIEDAMYTLAGLKPHIADAGELTLQRMYLDAEGQFNANSAGDSEGGGGWRVQALVNKDGKVVAYFDREAGKPVAVVVGSGVRIHVERKDGQDAPEVTQTDADGQTRTLTQGELMAAFNEPGGQPASVQQAAGDLKLEDISVLDVVSAFAPGGTSNLGGAYGHGQLNGFDILPLNDTSSFLLNSEGDIVGEMNLQPGGALQLKNLSGQSVYVLDDKVFTPAEYEQAQTRIEQAHAQQQANTAASAVGLMNSIIGLQNWDAMSDLQRTAALVSIYNTVDALSGGEALPGNLGAAAGMLGLLNALDQGNVGAAMVSGIVIVDSLASGAASNAIGNALNIPAGKVIPVLNLILAIDSGDPVSIIAAACAFIPVYGQLIAAVITICNALFGGDDIPMSEGAAHAQWDAAGNLQIVTDQDEHGGGPTAHAWMSALANGLQAELAKNTDEHGAPLYGLVPNLLPTIGFKHDPDGFNYSPQGVEIPSLLEGGSAKDFTPLTVAQGHMYLSWVDDNGIAQTRYYDGAGNRNDESGETLAGDFMQHAMDAIAPAWAVQTTLAHWQAGRGMHLPLDKASLPQESEDGITQTLQALTLAVPGFEPPRQSLIDVDADGYLEATQWVNANQAMLAGDTLGVAYRLTADGVLEITEQADGFGEAVNDARYLRMA